MFLSAQSFAEKLDEKKGLYCVNPKPYSFSFEGTALIFKGQSYIQWDIPIEGYKAKLRKIRFGKYDAGSQRINLGKGQGYIDRKTLEWIISYLPSTELDISKRVILIQKCKVIETKQLKKLMKLQVEKINNKLEKKKKEDSKGNKI
jgi:hypothetical protein